MNLDHRTSQVKGYALVEYSEEHEAEQAIAQANGAELAGSKLEAGWAYKQ
jgi:hypothetical protein